MGKREGLTSRRKARKKANLHLWGRWGALCVEGVSKSSPYLIPGAIAFLGTSIFLNHQVNAAPGLQLSDPSFFEDMTSTLSTMWPTLVTVGLFLIAVGMCRIADERRWVDSHAHGRSHRAFRDAYK